MNVELLCSTSYKLVVERIPQTLTPSKYDVKMWALWFYPTPAYNVYLILIVRTCTNCEGHSKGRTENPIIASWQYAPTNITSCPNADF